MAWKIDRDYIYDPEIDSVSAVGTMSLGPELEGKTFRFRLRDDDGNVYYGGVADEAAAIQDEELEHGGLTEAWEWGMYDSGATDLQMRPSDALEYGLTSPSYLEAHPPRDGWVSIFG